MQFVHHRKVNKLQLVRAFRRYFTKPYFIPVTAEVSLQHFLFIDHSASKPYSLVTTLYLNIYVVKEYPCNTIIILFYSQSWSSLIFLLPNLVALGRLF